MIEDKVKLAQKRAELVTSLSKLPPDQHARIQSELRMVNAQIKAINTSEAMKLKAAADQRRAAGLAEQHANTMRARSKIGLVDPPPGMDEDDDPGQARAIDGWIDAVLMRHDIEFTRGPRGLAIVDADIPQKVISAIELLVQGVNDAARGKELPDLPPAAPKPQKQAKASKKRS
jgi:hypothetical protein